MTLAVDLIEVILLRRARIGETTRDPHRRVA